MHKYKTRRHSWIWVSVLILFVCVAATTLTITDIMNRYLPNDIGAISLIPEGITGDENEDGDAGADTSGGTDNTPVSSTNSTPSTEQPEVETPKKPSFEAADNKTVWSTNTQVEIFRVFYTNGEQFITVQSSNGDKLIAPGTENSYVFKFRNTGDVALDYTVEIDAHVTPSDISVPITGRISRYDGTWITGNGNKYVDIPTLDTTVHSATLGAGRYTYYTLDWTWPYDAGNDELDTILGNMASEEALTFTIVITTTATESANPDDESGLKTPQTGEDISIIIILFALAIISLIMILILLIYKITEKRNIHLEAKNS